MKKLTMDRRRKLDILLYLRAMRRLAALALLLVAAPAYAAIPDELAVRAIMGEASNQGYTGMVAVGEAIRNRGTLQGVYGVKAKHVDSEPAWVWNQARKAWHESANTNLVKKADHWENTKAFGTPYWAKSMVHTATIGSHSFYRRASK